jgi:hypothetical protein
LKFMETNLELKNIISWILYLDHWRFKSAQNVRIKSVNGHHFERINPQACGFNSSKV